MEKKIITPGMTDKEVTVTLKINPQTGQMRAVGGDQLPGLPGAEGAYIGFEILKSILESVLTFDKYHHLAMTTKKYSGKYRLTYPTLGLVGEAGEVANKVKKVFRDDDGKFTEKRRDDIVNELGDILWYIAALADDMGVPLDVIARQNIEKLLKRDQEGTLQGEGDDR